MSKNIKEAFEKTKIAGSIAAGALDEVEKIIKPGISTEKLIKFVMSLLMTIELTLRHCFIEGFQSLAVLLQITLCVTVYPQIRF